jgi:hypothetical protein
MKDPFESKIKSLIEDFSYEYDPKAWDALSKKLPASKPSLSWLGKFGIASMLMLVVGIVGWVSLSSENQKVERKTNNVKHSSSTNAHPIEKNKLEVIHAKKQDLSPSASKQAPIKPQTIDANFIQNTFSAPSINSVVNNTITERQPTQAIVDELSELTNPLPLSSLQQTPNSQISIGDEQKAELAGNCQGPKIFLDADAVNYEDGTPRIKISADCNGSEISWSANGTLVQKKSRSVELLAFKGQTYTITAQAQLEGCVSTEKIKITTNEDYNLLAVNAFNPQSRDERNATFIPYALTIRDVRFEMIILDPDNGALVFKSTDSQDAWDGTDLRNGQLVPSQKAFIWKVVLQDALPNEKTTYTGTIVRI